MIQAARKHRRAVQVGTQRRSGPATREAIELLHAGAIGKVHSSRAYYANGRRTIGKGKRADVPARLDYGSPGQGSGLLPVGPLAE